MIKKIVPTLLLLAIAATPTLDNGFLNAEATNFFTDASTNINVTENDESYLISGFETIGNTNKIRITDKVNLDGLSFDFYINNPNSGQMAGFYFSNSENDDISTGRENSTTQFSLWTNKYADQDRFAIYQQVIDEFDFTSAAGGTYHQYGNQTYYVNKTAWNGRNGFAPDLSSNELILNHAPYGKTDYKCGFKFIFSKYSEHIYQIKIIEKEPSTIWKQNANFSNDGNGFFVTTYINDYYLPIDEDGNAYLYFYGYYSDTNPSPIIKLENFYNPNEPTRKVTYKYLDMISSTSREDLEIIVNKATLLEKPADPTLNGYTFVGWYKDLFYEYAWNFKKDTVDTNVTLYARWVKEGEPIPELIYEEETHEEVVPEEDEDNTPIKESKHLSTRIVQINWILFSVLVVLGIMGILAVGFGGFYLYRHFSLSRRSKEILKNMEDDK